MYQAFRVQGRGWRVLSVCGGVVVALLAGEADAAMPLVPADVLAPHRAIYDLSLVESRDQAGIRNAKGRLVYEFARKGCDAFLLNYRQAMALETGEGQGGVVDFRSVTEENDAGTRFDFQSQSVVSGSPETAISGSARRDGEGGIAVTLSQPEERSAELDPDALFPTQHMRSILAAARAGETVVETLVFDGGEPGDVPAHTLALIGAVKQPGSDDVGDVEGFEGLDRLPRWPVTISYFDLAEAEGEQTPKFTFAAELYENGIARALTLDYGRFVVEGKLVRVEALPSEESCTTP